MVINKYFTSLILSVFLSLVLSISAASAQDDGLLNSSFEAGISSWTVTESESVKVITGEDTTTSGNNQTFAVKVSPLHGTNLVRLGNIKNISENMNVGPNSVSQVFTPNGNIEAGVTRSPSMLNNPLIQIYP